MAKKHINSDRTNLDNAAVCMAETDPKSQCEKIESFLCRVFCCADKNPFFRKDGLYKQSCADKLLTALRTISNGGDSKEFGKHGKNANISYYNSLSYTMTPSEEERREHKTKEYSYANINGRLKKYKIRTPYVSIYDENMNLIDIYDFKFDGDKWREGQKEDYTRLLSNKKEPETIDKNRCNNCDILNNKKIFLQKKKQR